MPDTMPTTPADTAGAQGPTPGFESGLNIAPVSTGTAEGTAGSASVFGGLTIPSGNMTPNAPSGWNAKSVLIQVNGSPAAAETVKGGAKAPNMTRLSDLVKLVSAISTGHPLDGFDPQVIADVGKNAGLSPVQIASLSTGGANSDIKQKATTAAWKGITQNLTAVGVNLAAYPGVSTPPNSSNALNKLKELGGIPLEASTTQLLDSQGYDTSGMSNVSNLIQGHDTKQFQTGAPGDTYTPTPTDNSGKATLESQWDDFVSQWNANSNGFRQGVVQDLVGTGLLNVSNGQPSLKDVENAYQNLMLGASDNGVTVPAALNQLSEQEPAGTPPGTDINKENINQAYVMQQATKILGPNTITPNQATTLANLANAAGTSSSQADDAINMGIVSLYNSNNPSQDGASYAGLAYTSVQDALAQWGVPPTDNLIGSLVSSVLASGVDSPYQITTLAQGAAENYAKTAANNLYGPGVTAAAAAGTSIAQQAEPYMQTASALLGIPTTEMEANDPSGKWMAWSHDGTGDGGQMTQQEWSHYIQTDPAYNYQSSQTAQTQESGAAAGLLQLFGKLPNSAPNLPGPTVAAGSST